MLPVRRVAFGNSSSSGRFGVGRHLLCTWNTNEKQADSVWLIKTSELQFDDPPEILGRGTFGLVVRAEYRGTQVAVKRVIPPRTQNKDVSTDVIMVGSLGSKMEPKRRTQRSLDKDHYFDFNNDVCGSGSRESAGDAVLTGGMGSKIDSQRKSQRSLDKDHYFDFNKDACESGGQQITSLTLQRISNSSYEHNGKISTLEKATTKGGRTKTYNQLKADFIHEMRLLSKLRHPCITTVMGAVISPREEPLLVMELMDHGSLFDLLHNETMIVEGDMVLQILRDIAQGLRFLHAAKPQVIHGDLKAQNVLVDSKFRAKVADFGLSQKKGTGASGTIFGWHRSSFVESQPIRRRPMFIRSELFCMRCILAVSHTSEDVESEHEIVRQICDQRINKRPSIPRSMPPEVVTLMMACTDANPRVRPTFRDIDDDLKSYNVGNVEPGKMCFSMQNKKSWDTTLTATENLLLEIFPKRVAEALIKGQEVEPEHFDCVTIFFSDIVGFTTIASEMSPLKVSDMLDRLYMKFDNTSRTHDVFKVETIGDAWMGVTNLATPQADHTKRIADFAMDALRAASITMIDQEDASKGFVNIRVGFHSGPVIANVVGSRNPKYTLIGDTVNTSSRMESSSLPGRVLCSQRAAQLLGEQAPEYTLTSRGFIEVKGKGVVERCLSVTSDAQHENGAWKDGRKPRNKALGLRQCGVLKILCRCSQRSDTCVLKIFLFDIGIVTISLPSWCQYVCLIESWHGAMPSLSKRRSSNEELRVYCTKFEFLSVTKKKQSQHGLNVVLFCVR
jgi:class 3 adenylate cyclase